MIGNSNPLELHAKVIQQLITANLTLAEAWTWIEQLTRNESGNLTAFPLVVTGEVYTIGFDAGVMNVLPNMTVENSGNSSLPAPPVRVPTYWEAAWNSFTGMLEAAWNAVVAVATFIANVALAVIKWCIDFAVAIANGEGLTFFYNTVVKPFVDALLAFIKFIVDLAAAALRIFVDNVLNPALSAMKEAAKRIGSAWLSALDAQVAAGAAVASALLENLPVFAIIAALVVLVVTAIGYIINPFPFIGIILAAILSLVLMASLIAMVPQEEPASDPANVGNFLEGIDTKYGDGLWLFGLLDVALGGFAALGGKGAEDVDPAIPFLKAFSVALVAFTIGGFAIESAACNMGGTCPLGILSLWFSGLAITLSLIALLSASKGLTPGHKLAYLMFNGAMVVASTWSFLGDTGFVLKHCD
jgi:hypothetical protein